MKYKDVATRYERKRFVKNVSFNSETEKELLELAQTLNFSEWVKDKLENEVKRQKIMKL